MKPSHRTCMRRGRESTTLGTKLGRAFVVAYALLVLVIVLIALATTGCAPISPIPLEAKEPSWDGTQQNSGLIKDVAASMVVTPHWRARYNALVKSYGANFKPGIVADEGLTPAPGGNFFANHFARGHFFVMNAWDKSAMHQPAPPTTLLQKAGL